MARQQNAVLSSHSASYKNYYYKGLREVPNDRCMV